MKNKHTFISLNDCPFCGQKAIRVQHTGLWRKYKPEPKKFTNNGTMHGTWYVGCPSGFFEDCVDECEVHPSASWYAKLEDAEREWNKRNI